MRKLLNEGIEKFRINTEAEIPQQRKGSTQSKRCAFKIAAQAIEHLAVNLYCGENSSNGVRTSNDYRKGLLL